MTGMEYGTPEGGRYGQPEGGHYGQLDRGRRLEFTGPEDQSPSLRTDLILSIQINPEHTGFSTMTVECPPLDGLASENYLNGTVAYRNGPDTVFEISIEDMNHDEESGIVSIQGTAVEDKNLDGGVQEYTFEDIPTEQAIRAVLDDTGNDYRVYESPFTPIVDETIQQAENSGGFEGSLTSGEENTDGSDDTNSSRELPTSTTSYFPPDYVPSIHPTTPITIDDAGITSTDVCLNKEAEFGSTSASVVDESGASRGEAVLLAAPGDSVSVEFSFAHEVPAGWLDIAFRARKIDLGTGYDIFEFKLDGSTITSIRADQAVNYPDYAWVKDEILASEAVDARNAADDDPHTLEIIKQQGDDDIYVDLITPRDARFDFGANVDEQVDGNNALTGPPPKPDNLPLVFDGPASGALLDVIRWTVNYDVDVSAASPFLTIPENDKTVTSSEVIDSTYHIEQNVYDVPNDIETSIAYGGVFIGRYSEDNKTTTPTEDTKSQEVEGLRMDIDGDSKSIIGDEREFTGSFWDILKEQHDFSNRVLTVAHGGNHSGRVESFVRGDPQLETRETERWIVTGTSEEQSRERYANVVIVTGSNIEGGTAYQAVARNEREIRRMQRLSPPGDDGRRVRRVVDRSLTSNNDCRSKARSLLADLSTIKQAGDATIAPEIPRVGHPYLTPWTMDIDEWETSEQYSTIESASVTIEPGTEETSVSFETVGGITEVLENVAAAQNEQQTTIETPTGGSLQMADSLGIGYLSRHPLNEASFEIGGSAGEGTHGGYAVSRPDNMPSKGDADYVVLDANDLQTAINNAVSGEIIYIDDHIDISGFSDEYIPGGITLVGGYCDPWVDGRGPVLHSDTYNRHHFIADGEIDMWGMSFQGPRQDYFDPREQSGTESDYYTTAIRCSGTGATDGIDARIYGCEFVGYTVGGLELGTSSAETQAEVDRCTFEDNAMETYGYGIYQYNGHADIKRCYFNNNRHSIAGYGIDTESYYAFKCMVGPDAISHAFDMHEDGSYAGDHVHIERCTFPFTESYVYNEGQEGFRLRGESMNTSWIRDCHFYHASEPVAPGEQGDAYMQDVSGDSWVNFTQSGNNFGKRLEQNIGCPLNVPIEPKE